MSRVKKYKRNKIPYILLFLVICIASLYILHSISLLTGIENKIRTLLSFNLIVILGFCLYYNYKVIFHDTKKHIIYVIFFLCYSSFLVFLGYYINKAYSAIDKISTNKTTYYTSLITLNENQATSISDITSGTIGYLKDETSVDGNQIPKEIIETEKIDNKIIEYDSYLELLNSLLDKEIEYAFVPANYIIMFSNLDGLDFDNLESDTKVLYTKEKDIKIDTTSNGTSLTKPFTFLIMGVDSEEENINGSSFNGDALMLLTFNPTTLNTTILSIPRDSYVPIACFTGNKKNKITHAAWYGADCMMDTISAFLDIDIDYYIKINFKGVVKLIDELGGVEVDVPYSFCEQDSNRHFGSSTIYVKEGLQTLNGEEALALSRNRKSNSSKCSSEWTSGVRNDFVRGQNQQLVLRAILNKLKEVNSLDVLYNLLNTISNNMETNMTTSEMLSLYNIGKDILVKSNDSDMDELLGFTRLYLNGYDDYIYEESVSKKLYEYILYQNSINAVSKAMKINLGLADPFMEKEFTFDESEEYEELIIGKNVTGSNSVSKIPSLVGLSSEKAVNKLDSLDVDSVIRYISDNTKEDGIVIKQSVPVNTEISSVREVILTVVKNNSVN